MTTTREAALEAALQAIADLSNKSGIEFKRLHPMLSAALDKRLVEHWSDVLSEFADAALSTPATEPQGYVEGVAAIEIEELIEGLLDAQQDINLAANELMRQSLCDASALIDKTEKLLRQTLAARPAPQPAADTRVVPLHRLQVWLDCLVSSEIKAEIRAIIGNATPAPSDKIAEAARVREQAEVLCQIEIDRGDRNAQHQYAAGARACRDAIRALAGQGETP